MLAFQEGTQKPSQCETKAFTLAMPTEPVMSPARNSPKETIRFLHNIFQDKEKHPGVFRQQMRKNHNQKTELYLVEKQTRTHYL